MSIGRLVPIHPAFSLVRWYIVCIPRPTLPKACDVPTWEFEEEVGGSIFTDKMRWFKVDVMGPGLWWEGKGLFARTRQLYKAPSEITKPSQPITRPARFSLFSHTLTRPSQAKRVRTCKLPPDRRHNPCRQLIPDSQRPCSINSNPRSTATASPPSRLSLPSRPFSLHSLPPRPRPPRPRLAHSKSRYITTLPTRRST